MASKKFRSGLALLTLLLSSMTALSACAQGNGTVTTLGPNVSVNVSRAPDIDYNLNLANNSYFVFMPQNFNASETYGLVVYISPLPSYTQVPDDWARVLYRHKLILVAPQGAGNECQMNTRRGLAVLGALAIMQRYRIDPKRVYACGLSGGARTAGSLGFLQSDLFSGTIQNCGADFYHSVPKYYATSQTDTLGHPYGVVDVPPYNVQAAKAKVRFVLVTGTNDFRRGNVTDLYYYGFKQEGFKVKFMDVAGMGHEDCNGDTLEQAINFIEGKGQ